MVSKIIDWSLDNPFVVMLLAVVLLGVGAMSMASLPLDAPVEVEFVFEFA